MTKRGTRSVPATQLLSHVDTLRKRYVPLPLDAVVVDCLPIQPSRGDTRDHRE